MIHFLILIIYVLSVKCQLDLNPIHRLCQPCIYAANAVKNTNKSPNVKEAEKKTCNAILKNDLVCNGAVEVAGIYLNWTPAEKICENFQMCSAFFDGKKRMRAPIKGGKKIDHLALKVLDVFETDEFPVFQSSSRFSRQVELPQGITFNFEEIQKFEKFLQEHYVEFSEAISKFLNKFQTALEVYNAATNTSNF